MSESGSGTLSSGADENSGLSTITGGSGQATVNDVTTLNGDDPPTGGSGESSGGQAACGDGHTDPGEACDEGGDSESCDADCTAVECGDGYVNAAAGEACDDGDQSPGDKCSSTCLLTEIASMVAGYDNVCLIFVDGRLRCWGSNSGFQLAVPDPDGLGDSMAEIPAPDIATGGMVSSAAFGFGSMCAVISPGKVKCWGSGLGGQLGYGDEATKKSPPEEFVNLGGLVEEIVGGSFGNFCVRTADGRVRCWGSYYSGIVGFDNFNNFNNVGDDPGEMPPAEIKNLQGVISLAASAGNHACALHGSGKVFCWGSNDKGQLGQSSIKDLTPVPLGLMAKSVAVGGEHTCAVLDNGGVRCWGANSSGQLGYGHTNTLGDQPGEIEMLAPVDLPGPVTHIVAGESHTCALLESGQVYCWGRNQLGELGQGHTNDLCDEPGELPAKVALGGDADMIASSGGRFTCVRLVDNTLRCWGRNDYGQLGLNDTLNVGDDELPDAVESVPF